MPQSKAKRTTKSIKRFSFTTSQILFGLILVFALLIAGERFLLRSRAELSRTPLPSPTPTIDLPFEPYQRLTRTAKGDVFVDPKGQGLHVLAEAPESSSILIGPDGKTVHLYGVVNEDKRNTDGMLRPVPKSICLDLSSAEKLPLNVRVKRLNSGLPDCSEALVTANGDIVSYRRKDGNLDRMIVMRDAAGVEKEIRFELKHFVEPTKYFHSPSFEAWQYLPAQGMTSPKGKESQEIFAIFDHELVLIKPQTNEAVSFSLVNMPDTFPLNLVTLVNFHPTQKIAIVSTGWEGADEARYIIDYTNIADVHVVTLQEDNGISSNEVTRWQDKKDGWIYDNNWKWTATGVQVTVNTPRELIDYEASLPLTAAVTEGLAYEQQIAPLLKLELEKERELAAANPELKKVICSFISEGPGSGYGCLGLEKTEIFTYTKGEKILVK
jgi:hypothetical protein